MSGGPPGELSGRGRKVSSSVSLEVPLENYLEGDGRSPPWSPWSRSCGEYRGRFDPYLSSALVAEMVWGWSCLSQVPVSGELREVEGGLAR